MMALLCIIKLIFCLTCLPRFSYSQPSFSHYRRQLSDLLDSTVVPTLSSFAGPIFENAARFSKNLPGASVLQPLLESVGQVASGQGEVEGVLGTVEGVLGEEQTFDYIIIGGGTAGIPVGVRLAEAGFTVAIVEAGIQYEIGKPVLGTTPAGAFFGVGWSQLDQIPTVDWGLTTEPQEGNGYRRMHYARGRCLGGSSALNFLIYHRGTTGSYDWWAEQVGDGSYRLANLWPYFLKSATLTGPNNDIRRANATTLYDPNAFSTDNRGGPIQVGYTNWVSVWTTWMEKGLKAVGILRTLGFNSGSLLGYHYSQSTIRTETQSRSASDEYLKLVKDNHKLKVYTQTLVKQILFNGTTAIGVRAESLLLQRNIYARREVILSAGTFQSPQILMVSGVGPPATLDALGIPIVSPLDGVGQNMWDHIILGPTHQVPFDTVDRFLHDPVVLAETVVEYLGTPPTGPLTSNVVELLGWEKLPEKYRQTWSPETRAAMSQFPADWPEVEYTTGNGYLGDFWFPVLQQPLDFKQYATIFGAMVATTSRGNITIRSRDTLEPPVITANFLQTKADQEVAISWFRRMREVWATPELQSITITQSDGDPEYWPGSSIQSDEELLELIRKSFMTVWHASSTCKMGRPEDKMAVVDSQGRVYGTQSLRVVDTSIFPFLPPGHPQSTLYALAEKIADSIIQNS